MNVGVIHQVIGPVVDIDFSEGGLPGIYNAVKIPRTNTEGEEEELKCSSISGRTVSEPWPWIPPMVLCAA
jgi:F0F1-type ATP synthase beta subunit